MFVQLRRLHYTTASTLLKIYYASLVKLKQRKTSFVINIYFRQLCIYNFKPIIIILKKITFEYLTL